MTYAAPRPDALPPAATGRASSGSRLLMAGATFILTIAVIAVGLMSWKTFSNTVDVYGGQLDVAVNVNGFGLGTTEITLAGVTDTDSGGGSALVLLLTVITILLALLGAILQAAGKAARFAASLITLAGLSLIISAFYMISVFDGTDMVGSDDDWGSSLQNLASDLATGGELSTKVGAYLGLVIGILLLALGIWAFTRAKKTPAVAAPVPAAYPGAPAGTSAVPGEPGPAQNLPGFPDPEAPSAGAHRLPEPPQ